MTASQFLNKERPLLISKLESYIAGDCSHLSVQELIRRIFNNWESVTNKDSQYQENEEEFWCAVWSVQHLATEDHWQDGVAQKDLTSILHTLKENNGLPEGWCGKRP